MYLNDQMLDSGALARRLLAPDNNLVPVNLLTRTQASNEDTLGWGATGTNCTVARSTTYAAAGSASAAVTITTGGSAARLHMTAGTGVGISPVVQGGKTYTYRLSVYIPSTAGSGQFTVELYWFKADGSASSTASTSLGPTTATAGVWKDVVFTTVAPADAAFARPTFYVYSGGAVTSEVWYFDAIGLWEGAGGSWVNGGERLDPSTLGWYWDESVGRRLFVWDTNNSRWQMVYGDTGWRNITASLVNGWTASEVFLRRHGATVTMIITSLNATSSSSEAFLSSVPSGFQPQGANGQSMWIGPAASTAGALREVMVETTQARLRGRDTAITNYRGTVVWSTTDAWPTTLPGTASGSIPFN